MSFIFSKSMAFKKNKLAWPKLACPKLVWTKRVWIKLVLKKLALINPKLRKSMAFKKIGLKSNGLSIGLKYFWSRLAFMLFVLGSSSLSASMQANLDQAFKTLGLSHNVTTGGGYQDQTGGFYTGGSMFARSKVNNADLLSLQLPHYRAGCGGIDIFAGGFSYINSQEFIALLRSIGSNASGYAFNLALATVTPQIKSVLDDLLAKVQKMTNQSINSCEAAATLVGGV